MPMPTPLRQQASDQKKLAYMRMLTNWMSRYVAYCAALTAQREGSWSATGCVRRAHGAPYITTPLATSEYRLKQPEIPA